MSTSEQSPASLMADAKEIKIRFNRNYNALRSLRASLDVKKPMLAALLKQKKSLDEDVDRLTAEIPKIEERVAQLATWCADHSDMSRAGDQAEALAAKIARMSKELERKREELRRIEMEEQIKAST